jgi:hypothetical protein
MNPSLLRPVIPLRILRLALISLVGFAWPGFCLLQAHALAETNQPPQRGDFIRVSDDGRGFEFSESKAKFVPWGFNYDHDADFRLLEEYWIEEWEAVEGDFAEMKALGANTVRIHLQVSHFMKSANRKSLDQLARLLKLAEKTGLYLDVTGLGCYRKADVPGWYNELDETQRWAVQARFWEAVAQTCSQSRAVFCYDLMNEPVITEDKKGRDWTPGEFGGFHYVQRLTLDFAGRTREEIAEAWVERMVAAIRKHDSRHLITVGVIPWAHKWPNAKPIFYSKEVGKHLDFVSVHFYPEKGEVAKALKALAVYDIGKPIVIEEMFPLKCTVAELDEFIEGSRKVACGWIGFYWGKTIEEYRRDKSGISGGITLDWLEYFVKKTPEILGSSSSSR